MGIRSVVSMLKLLCTSIPDNENALVATTMNNGIESGYDDLGCWIAHNSALQKVDNHMQYVPKINLMEIYNYRIMALQILANNSALVEQRNNVVWTTKIVCIFLHTVVEDKYWFHMKFMKLNCGITCRSGEWETIDPCELKRFVARIFNAWIELCGVPSWVKQNY